MKLSHLPAVFWVCIFSRKLPEKNFSKKVTVSVIKHFVLILATFTGLKHFIQSCINECRKQGKARV